MRYALSECTFENIDNGHEIIFTGPCVATGKMVSVAVSGSGLEAYHKGALIQEAFPDLSKQDREFLVSGYSAEGWNQLFPPEEEEISEDSEDFS